MAEGEHQRTGTQRLGVANGGRVHSVAPHREQGEVELFVEGDDPCLDHFLVT